MKKKQGISLIVLVITIIVMIILAASVVITLSNSGIIEKANEAVNETNIKEVQQLATITWAEEFMDGKRGDTLKTAVLDRLKDYTDKYDIEVDDTGVTVTQKGNTDAGAGLYRTGTAELLYSWDELIKNGIIYVTNDGAVYTRTMVCDSDDEYNNIVQTLTGDLILPNDGTIKSVGTYLEDEEWYVSFCSCENLTSVTLPESLERLNYMAFDSCSNLETINIMEGTKLAAMENQAISRTKYLTINYPGTTEQWVDVWEAEQDYTDWSLEDYGSHAAEVVCSNGTVYLFVYQGE